MGIFRPFLYLFLYLYIQILSSVVIQYVTILPKDNHDIALTSSWVLYIWILRPDC